MTSIGVLLALGTACVLGWSNIYVRRASVRVDGPHAVLLTLTYNVVLVVPLLMLVRIMMDEPIRLTGEAAMYFALAGITGGYAGRFALYVAIKGVGPSRASLLKNSAPLFAVVFSFVLLDQLPTGPAALGILCVLVSLWYLSSADLDEDRRRRLTLTGAIAGIGAAIAYAAADTFRALGLLGVHDIIVGAAFALVCAWAVALTGVLLRGRRSGAQDPNEPGTVRTRVLPRNDVDLIRGSVLMGLGQLLNFGAIAVMYVSYVSAFIATAPLFTALFSRLQLRGDEVLARPLLISGTGVAIGAALIAMYG